MQDIQKRKMIIRIGRNSLSFTTADPTDRERPIIYEPYNVKGSISIAANMREALRTVGLTEGDWRLVQVVMDTPPLLIPIEQFEEDAIEELYHYTFPATQEAVKICYNVLPDLKAVCVFAVNRDLYGVIHDRFDEVQYIQALTPVWRHLHQRSFTGHHGKLYAYFHGRQLNIFSFQQNRFKYCNAFEAANAHDALYFMLYVWQQLRLDATHDELHMAGSLPDREWMVKEVRQYLQKIYVINPSADFGQVPATKIVDMPYDLMTLIVKGR